MKVTVRNLSFAYSARPTLIDVDLEVQKGEILAVVGPNGAGKSTLLRAISGALRPQKGVIYLDFRITWEFPARERAQKLAMVEQGAQPAFDFTVQELVELGRLPHLGRWQGFRRVDAAAVAQALTFAGLTHLACRRWSELSGGERQRTLLAMAFAQEPEILLLDEPTAHLDVAHQIESMQLIAKFAEKGGTVIMAIHDLNLAAAFAHRLALLHHGRLLACGTPQEVLTPALLREVFGVEAAVRVHPLTGRVHVHFLLTPSRPRLERRKGRVLVLGGGGSVEDLLPPLAAEYEVILGVVAPLDSDYQVAQALGIPAITEAPFSPISDTAYAELCRSLAEVEAVVVGPTWFGPGNLRMLEALVSCNEYPVLIVDAEGAPARDYTGGRATALLQALLAQGARPVSKKEVLSALSSLLGHRTQAQYGQSEA